MCSLKDSYAKFDNWTVYLYYEKIAVKLQTTNGPCWKEKKDSQKRMSCHVSYSPIIDTPRYSERQRDKRDRPSLIILPRRQSSSRNTRWSKELSGSGTRIRYEVIPLTRRTCARVQIYSIFDTPRNFVTREQRAVSWKKGDSSSYCLFIDWLWKKKAYCILFLHGSDLLKKRIVSKEKEVKIKHDVD